MKKLFSIAILALSALLTGCGSGTIEQGNVGVAFDWEKEYVGTVGSGFYFKPTQTIDEYTMKEVNIPFDNLRPTTADNLQMAELDVNVMYRVKSKEGVGDLAVKYKGQSAKFDGDDYYLPAYFLVQSTAGSEISDAVSKFDSLKIHQSRDALAAAIAANTQKALDAMDPGKFQITRVIVTKALPDTTIAENIRKVVNKQKEKEAADLQLGIEQSLAAANAAKARGLPPEILQERYIDALKSCAVSNGCTMVVDSSSTQKIFNIGK